MKSFLFSKAKTTDHLVMVVAVVSIYLPRVVFQIVVAESN